jgi:hypothetical protein
LLAITWIDSHWRDFELKCIVSKWWDLSGSITANVRVGDFENLGGELDLDIAGELRHVANMNFAFAGRTDSAVPEIDFFRGFYEGGTHLCSRRDEFAPLDGRGLDVFEGVG